MVPTAPNPLLCEECLQHWLRLSPIKRKRLSGQIHPGVEPAKDVVATFQFPLAQGFSTRPGHPKDGQWWRTTCVLAALRGQRAPSQTQLRAYTAASGSHLSEPRATKAATGPSSVLEGALCSCANRTSLACCSTNPPRPSKATDNHILQSSEWLCKGERPLLNPLLCPLTACVCGCLILREQLKPSTCQNLPPDA